MASTAIPLATFRLWTQYFRYETEGFETIASAESSLIVAYHGGPWAFDLFMLATRMHDELGYFPRAVWHPLWWRVPGVRDAVAELGGIAGKPSDDEIAELKARGEHLVITPGGTREGLRPFWRRGQVDFGRRRGYLRLAHAHGLPIIPVVASGLDETFLGLNDGHAWSKRLFGDDGVPVWLGLGLGGVWPLALPFPVKIRQLVGAPIDVMSLEVEEAHARVTATLQEMLDGLHA